ncbi:MAG: nickel pincer cofactor biosynthesis protein LarC [Candidatus Eisenbacteria bacterium]
MRVAHWELWTGIAGDMWVGACLDAGWSEERLLELPARLGLSGVTIEVESRKHSGFVGRGIRVTSGEHHPHRGLSDIRRILESAELDDSVRARSLAVFTRLGEAEARVHGISVDRVHFHEVGALDAIVDVVGAVQALADLGVESVTATSIPISGGQVTAAHGTMPVPAPATAFLLEGWPVRPCPGDGEWVTPTGAALLSVIAHPVDSLPALRVDAVGLGAGTKSHPHLPNLVRLWIGEQRGGAGGGRAAGSSVHAHGSASEQARDGEATVVSILETQVDDMTGEEIASLVEQLRAEGALDVVVGALQMKKGRPGARIQVVTRPEDAPGLASQMFASSSTLGVRRREEMRYERARGTRRLATPWGEVGLKWVGSPDDPEPDFEHDDLVRISRDRGVPLRQVERDLVRLLPSGNPNHPSRV